MRILMRSGKKPFDAISYESVLQDNVLGTNAGNLILRKLLGDCCRLKAVLLIQGGIC